jgi:predicted site-specific integrase-resolvase
MFHAYKKILKLLQLLNAMVITMAMIAMKDRNTIGIDVAKRLGITTTTLYKYVNGDGSLKAVGENIMNK